jgi:peptide/nickel transport system substrate-binding protein
MGWRGSFRVRTPLEGLSMTGNRATRLVILAAVTAVAVGCSSVSGPATSGGDTVSDPTAVTTSSEATVGGVPADTITVGLERAPGGYNSGNATANTVFSHYVDNLTQSNFAVIDPTGQVQRNTEFGTYQKISDDPLTVTYTIDDEAVWSDGVPIDCDDAMLAWAARSGSYPSGQPDATGKDVDIFTPSNTNGFAHIEKPTCRPGDKSFTLVYTEPYADWDSLFTGPTFMPAHIAAEKGGLSSADNGAALIAAIESDDIALLTPVAKFWNTGWDYLPELPSLLPTDLLPASGPYRYDSGSNGTLTVVKNDKWWGTPAVTPRFIFQVVDPQEWVQAMANGEIDAFDPSNPSQDTVSQLGNLGDKVTFEIGQGLTFSHLDFDSSPEGKLADIRVRQAFLKCIPRQELVDKFAKTVDPAAQLLNLREFLPAQPAYQEVLQKVPEATQYDVVDIAGAQQLLASAGVQRPYDLRIIRTSTSALRGQQVELIKASCDQAGFNIIDTPDANLFTTLTSRGTWDAALFSWSASGRVAETEGVYVTGGKQNYGGYSDPDVDASWAQITKTIDEEQADELKVPLERALWTNPYNAPLYATPKVTAFVSTLHGPVVNPTQSGITWNAATWTKSVA